MPKLKYVFVFLAALAFATANTVYAAEFIKPSKDDPNITVPAGETHKNLYVAGGNVTVNGNVLGDLTVAGGMVNVVGDVEQDAMVAGGSLVISGKIGGDARVGGGNISVSAPIGGDLLVGGGNVSLSAKAGIGGDLVAGAGNFIVDAPVKGNVKIAGGNVTLNSKIDGDVQVIIGGNSKDNGNLIFGPQAEVLGKITYKGPKPAVVKEGAKVGEIEYTPYTKGAGFPRGAKAFFTFGLIIKLFAWIIAGLLLVRFKRNWVEKLVESVKTGPWSNLGWGLAALIVVPIITVILLISMIGYYLAFLLGLWFMLTVVYINLAASVVTGFLVMKYLSKPGLPISGWQAVVVGVVIFILLGLIPILGWLAILVLFLLSFGAALRILEEQFKN